MVTLSLLNDYLGRGISDICPHGYDAGRDNHCAHFVSHALNLSFGLTCASMKGIRGATAAANLRVHEIFDQCTSTREVIACPATGEGLIFVSDRRSFHQRPGGAVQLRNVPKKHIGIALNGTVWHYSNSRDRVVNQSVAEFLFHYPRQQNALWWGAFPVTAQAAGFATSPALQTQ
jgi:hypothetical protein